VGSSPESFARSAAGPRSTGGAAALLRMVGEHETNNPSSDAARNLTLMQSLVFPFTRKTTGWR